MEVSGIHTQLHVYGRLAAAAFVKSPWLPHIEASKRLDMRNSHPRNHPHEGFSKWSEMRKPNSLRWDLCGFYCVIFREGPIPGL